MSYQIDRKWSDKFIPEIRRIVGPHLLQESSFETDATQAADLVVLKARDMTIAARVRRHGYSERYPFEFTVRSKRDTGSKTELAKLMEGWGDWMFYAHSNKPETGFDRWMIIDLSAWREHLIKTGYSNNGWQHLSKKQSNSDGTYFVAFDVRYFPKKILISSNCELLHLESA